MNKQELREKLIELKDNGIFPSNEDEDTIEHVDLGYRELIELLQQTIDHLEPNLGE